VVEAVRRFQAEFSRAYCVTPTVCIELFTIFGQILAKRAGDLDQREQQPENGGGKLAETGSTVQEIEAEPHSLRPLLQQKAVETSELMAKCETDMEKMNGAHETISAEEETVRIVRSEAVDLMAEAQDGLDRALALLQAALTAVEEVNAQLDASPQVPIGVNTDGPPMAGTLGTDEPASGIIGDPVDVAVCPQSAAIPAAVQVSQGAYDAIASLTLFLVR